MLTIQNKEKLIDIGILDKVNGTIWSVHNIEDETELDLNSTPYKAEYYYKITMYNRENKEFKYIRLNRDKGDAIYKTNLNYYELSYKNNEGIEYNTMVNTKDLKMRAGLINKIEGLILYR